MGLLLSDYYQHTYLAFSGCCFVFCSPHWHIHKLYVELWRNTECTYLLASVSQSNVMLYLLEYVTV